jgi:hypothetical protein
MWNLCVSIETRVENWSNREKEKEKEWHIGNFYIFVCPCLIDVEGRSSSV